MSDLIPLSDVINGLAPAGDGFSLTIPPGWGQGRSAFGGLTGALAVNAMRQKLGADERPLRSLLVSFVAPVLLGEKADIEANMLRAGKSVIQAESRLISGGSVAAVAQAAFGHARPTKSSAPLAAFTPEPRDSVPAAPFVKGLFPDFLENFEIRWTGGGIPSSGSNSTRIGMWVRFRKPVDQTLATERLIAIADMPPPAMLSHYRERKTASSLTWSLDFLVDPREVTGEWFYLDFSLDAADGGYCQQTGRIFTEDGRLVMIGHQVMVYFE
ncbi:thioesterase family protein [Pseudokordiimonas caeni]|uniref:thioesterase family protein n=1 Tax=Pseudokordiimonas caeni TaxID=2997908 RepID=UPI0028121D57|nr:thioesterase family protein [Pseudokordiimonas caeni]